MTKESTQFFQLGYKHGRDLKNRRMRLKYVPTHFQAAYTFGFNVARRQAIESRKNSIERQKQTV